MNQAMMNLADKNVLVLGLGESGLAMTQWLLDQGARVRVADTRPAPERLPLLNELGERVSFQSGEFDAALLADAELLLLSPGLSPLKELATILPAAAERQIPVWGEVELFAHALESLKLARQYQPKIIAITGTNGKTTVTSLTGQLCQRAGLSARVAGNISPAMLEVLRQAIRDDQLPQVWVLELSSFQLHSTQSLNADAATVLNISQDHLDWHGSMAAYCDDKRKIFGPDTVRVLNRDDALVMAMASPSAECISFGVQSPEQAGDFGLLPDHSMSWLAFATPLEDAVPSTGRRRKKEAEPVPFSVSRLMPTDALQIRGQHNAMNALAALALCRAIGLPFAPLLHGLREYQGEPHRVEWIASVAGVDYIDDSKGTNVGATAAALKGLGQQSAALDKRIILIAGGEGKGQDFSPLAEPVQRYVKAVLLIGKARAELTAVLQDCATLQQCDSLEQAVAAAAGLAAEGDSVLLSPACASLDMFRNYAHRAEVFAAAVRELALDSGEIA